MKDILNNLSPETLTPLIEKNMQDLFTECAQLTGSKYYIDENISWINSSPSPWPNGIYFSQLSEATVNEEIQKAADEIRKGNAANRWFTGPNSRPSNLEKYLICNGFSKLWDTAGMAIDLSAMKSDFPVPDGLQIEIVKGDKSLESMSEIIVPNLFKGSSEDTVNFVPVLKQLRNSPNITFFLACLDGVPVATSTLYFSSGVAGIYIVATSEEYRSRGIGRHIVLAPLLHARKMGYKAAILQATALGEIIYKKIGFKEYCKLGRFKLEL